MRGYQLDRDTKYPVISSWLINKRKKPWCHSCTTMTKTRQTHDVKKKAKIGEWWLRDSPTSARLIISYGPGKVY